MTYSVCTDIVARFSPSNNAAAGGSIARADTPARLSPIDHLYITGHSAGCTPPRRCPAGRCGWPQWRNDRASGLPAAMDRPQLITTPTILGRPDQAPHPPTMPIRRARRQM